ncbi:MAG TPA: hypothetical protein VLZ05_02055 [Mycobacterium sp.]|nr:hypothetical protein [Mycobacterium sp.]
MVSPGDHGFGAAVEGPSDPVGQRLTVEGFGGDVVGGAGLFVWLAMMAGASWAASRLVPR